MRGLNLAFDELDGREHEAGGAAAEGAAQHQSLKWQGGDPSIVARCCCCRRRRRRRHGTVEDNAERTLRQPVRDEQAARLDGGADERCTDAPVEAGEAALAQRLSEAVERAGIAQGLLVRLRLEANLDRVEGIFDDLADEAGDLGRVRSILGSPIWDWGARTEPKVMSVKASALGLLVVAGAGEASRGETSRKVNGRVVDSVIDQGRSMDKTLVVEVTVSRRLRPCNRCYRVCI